MCDPPPAGISSAKWVVMCMSGCCGRPGCPSSTCPFAAVGVGVGVQASRWRPHQDVWFCSVLAPCGSLWDGPGLGTVSTKLAGTEAPLSQWCGGLCLSLTCQGIVACGPVAAFPQQVGPPRTPCPEQQVLLSTPPISKHQVQSVQHLCPKVFVSPTNKSTFKLVP